MIICRWVSLRDVPPGRGHAGVTAAVDSLARRAALAPRLPAPAAGAAAPDGADRAVAELHHVHPDPGRRGRPSRARARARGLPGRDVLPGGPGRGRLPGRHVRAHAGCARDRAAGARAGRPAHVRRAAVRRRGRPGGRLVHGRRAALAAVARARRRGRLRAVLAGLLARLRRADPVLAGLRRRAARPVPVRGGWLPAVHRGSAGVAAGHVAPVRDRRRAALRGVRADGRGEPALRPAGRRACGPRAARGRPRGACCAATPSRSRPRR